MASEAVARGVSGRGFGKSRKKRRWSGVRRKDAITGYLFLLPNLVGLLTFSIFPIAYAIYLTFHSWDLASPPEFIGFGNIVRMADDWLFWKTLGNTAYYAFAAVPTAIVIAFWLAVMINRKMPGVLIFRVIYFLPNITLSVAAAQTWSWIFHPQFGLLNYLLSLVGIQGPFWLLDSRWSMPSVMVVSIWQGVGYAMLVFLAGLQGIPAELYEAAIVDGANPWHQLRYVTIPMLSPTIFFILTTSFIGAFQGFDLFFLLTQGGPAHSTTTLVYHIFNNAFRHFRMGYATSMAAVLFFLILTLTLVQWRAQRAWVYQG